MSGPRATGARRRLAARSVPLALAAAVAVLAVAGTAFGTYAAFTDTDPAAPGTSGAATVVLGGRGNPPTLAFTGLRTGGPRTLPLTIDYRGSVPATISLQFPSGAQPTSCKKSGLALLDDLQVGGLNVTLGSRSAESWCTLLDGTARTVLATLAPGTTTTVPITVAVTGLPLLSRSERAELRIRSVGGFTDQVAGTVTITTVGVLGGKAAARAVAPAAVAPAAAAAGAVAAPTPPAECTAAGLTSFSEVIALTPEKRRFVAAEDRPDATGPFLVVGTAGDDTVVGSPAGDCVAGAGGADVVDGAAGDDVLVGSDGDDTLTGGDGDDRLVGGVGSDTLTGGPGADTLDGGADGGSCPDADASDTVVACTVPPAGAAVVVPPAPVPAAATPTAPPAPTDPPAVPEGAPDTTTPTPAPEPTTEPAPPT